MTQYAENRDQCCALMVYELTLPLDIDRDVRWQVSHIVENAKLVQFNPHASALLTVSGIKSFRSMGLRETLSTLRIIESSTANNTFADIDTNSSIHTQLQRFVEARYELEDTGFLCLFKGSPAHYNVSYYGTLDGRFLTHLVTVYRDNTRQVYRHTNGQKALLSQRNDSASRLKEKHDNLIEQQRLAFIENSTSGMFVMDVCPPMSIHLSVHKQLQHLAENTRIVECNHAIVNMLGHTNKQSLLGESLYGGLVSYDFATIAKDYISERYEFRDHIIKITLSDGTDKWISSTNSSVIKDDNVVQLLGVITDVTDRVLHTREMEYRAKHDDLTGLPNRSYFIEEVEQSLLLCQSHCKHALFLLDLDGFKEVNDTLGHEIGDCLLQQIGPRVKPVLETYNAVIARLGGDEFAIFIEDFKSRSAIVEFAGSLMAAIKSPFKLNSLELAVGGSVGISLYPDDGNTLSSLMRCADVAMYQAKKQSSDFCFYQSEQDHYTVRRLSLMMDVRQAIENNEMELFYQPIIELNTQEVLGVEALIRWQHSTLGMLSPSEFVPLIELTDMIKPMTVWVVETAIKQLAEWRSKELSYYIAVNISTRNLIDCSFANFIESCLQQYGVQGSRLELEITESTLMSDPEKARIVLQSLSELGTPISIDDYGTGYSSLAYLKSLPITTLKIDRTFISQMEADAQDKIIVSSTIQLAHNLGLEVTAEGIEDAALIQELCNLGCDKGQGFHICRPKPLAELNLWLEEYHQQLLSQKRVNSL